MNISRLVVSAAVGAAVITTAAFGMGGGRHDKAVNAPAATPKPTLSAALQKDMDAGSAKAVAFLLSKQIPDGSWLQHPAVTALAAAAVARSPQGTSAAAQAAVNKGLDFVVKHAKPDGSIWNTEAEDYPNYSTSVSLVALALVNRPQDQQVIRNARDFLLDSQFTDVVGDDAKAREALAPQAKQPAVGKQVDKANPAYGGVGYGKEKRPDLSNTQWALEALALTDHLDREPFNSNPAKAQKADLAWERAITFLSRCQNLKGSNDQTWVVDDPKNRGGFVYMPGSSKAGEEEVEGGNKALRSYGSMTYAGLKSMIYAKLKKDDPRVKAAVEWIKRNYTFDTNPGLGQEGLYYYLHTCSKALAVLDEETLTDAAGKPRAWREEIVRSVLAKQRENGSWFNDNNRWWESQPELVTAYALLTLEIATGLDQHSPAK